MNVCLRVKLPNLIQMMAMMRVKLPNLMQMMAMSASRLGEARDRGLQNAWRTVTHPVLVARFGSWCAQTSKGWAPL